jgi:anthranilate synthase component 1
MQVQVGQRIHKRYTESPLSLYRAALAQPQPLHVLLPLGRLPCGGRQPEILVRQERTEEGRRSIRPLAGTRPRGATPEKDKAAEPN